MSRITTDVRPIAFAVVVCALLTTSCSSLPRIDPTGEHFFVPPECSSSPPCDPFLVPVPGPPCEPSVPGVAAPCPPDQAYAPSGPVPEYKNMPGGACAPDAVQLMLSPRQTIAPVGTEVVLLAGVLGPDRYLRTNQRIEWTIDSGGVGQFVDLGGKSATDWLVGDFNWPRKISPTAAVGTTTRSYLRLTRGTPSPEDDVQVLRGQAWITATSPAEGITYVTAYSPCVAGWQGRKETAIIHWVNAQWRFPAPSINPAGSRHVFTTTVTRHTDQSPCEGWLVRYEILDGPPAGFVPDGVQAVEVPTDPAGQASAEIFQLEPGPGVNRIRIQVIRPASIDGADGRRLLVGEGTTSETWSAADISVRKSGPATAGLGSTIIYRIDVTNPGDLPADGVAVSDEIPAGLTFLSSNPPGQVSGGLVRWELGQLAAGQSQSIQVQLRADRQGSVTSCAEASIPSGLKARDCVSTTIGVAAVDVRINGPTTATVGDEVTFTVVVTNRGQLSAGRLLIKDRFGEGLEHAVAKSPIERDLGPELLPGQSRQIGVQFRVTKPGRLCNTVEILSGGTVQASAEACLTATAAPAAQPQPQLPLQPQPKPQPQPEPKTQPKTQPPTQPQPKTQPPTQPPTQPQPKAQPQFPPVVPSGVSLKLQGPRQRRVGETAAFTMDVVNTSTEALKNLRLESKLDAAFDPSMATPGYHLDADTIWWSIDTLASGAKAEFQLEARSISPAQSACNRVQVTADGRVLAKDEACVKIETAPLFSPAGLSMTIEDRHDPITAGKELTYEIRVENEGRQTDEDVVVVVTVPQAETIVPLETWGPAGADIDGQTIRFHPVEKIEPGGSIVYRVRVQAKLPGQTQFKAQLTSRGLREPLVMEEQTMILAAQ